jgi:predicted nucleotidyltransferase component of viral defense system
MINTNKHRFYLFQILKDIYANKDLAALLAFKGGTALMFFYELPRFSVYLDFNLLSPSKETFVYDALKQILLKHGSIHDEAIKHHSILLVLDYGVGERKLKVEVSNRDFGDHYEIKNLFGVNVQLMVMPDMFAHKLCAMLDRTAMANRDIFDCWYFMTNKTAINASIVERRMKLTLYDYLQQCIVVLETKSDKGLLNGLGELMDDEMKTFVRKDLRMETVQLLRFYQKYPILTG